MQKKIIVIVLLLGLMVLLLLGIGYRYRQVMFYPMGGGQYQESPDKRHIANASSMIDEDFFGAERRYYEFRIETGQHHVLRRLVIEEPREGMIGWRDEGKIQWAPDSSAVTYTFGGTQLILNIKP